MNISEELEKAGLSRVDIKDVEYIEEVLGGNSIPSRLIIKAYNQGFKKGVKESINFIDCNKKGIDY